MAVLSDPDLKKLAEAFAVLAEKEFGHVLKPGDEFAWLMVGAMFVARLQPKYRNLSQAWFIYAGQINELIGEKSAERSTGLGNEASPARAGYATDWD